MIKLEDFNSSPLGDRVILFSDNKFQFLNIRFIFMFIDFYTQLKSKMHLNKFTFIVPFAGTTKEIDLAKKTIPKMIDYLMYYSF